MNRKFTIIVLTVIAALLLPMAIVAQTPQAVLAYADNEDALSVIGADGKSRPLYIGDTVAPGETIKTANTTAELKLVPNGTIIKISRNTSFTVEALADEQRPTNGFALLIGKIRAIASKTSGRERYQIRTPTAVCGVRGTDFSLNVVPGMKDSLFVKRGLVEFSRLMPDNTLQSIMVGGGQFADTFATAFQAATFSAEQFANEYSDLEFEALDPDAVVQQPVEAAAETADAEDNEAPASDPSGSTTDDAASASGTGPAAGATSSPQIVTGADTSTGEIDRIAALAAADGSTDGSPSEDQPTFDRGNEKVFEWLSEVLGFEAGATTIEGVTYSKVVLQPEFTFGKLRTSLYLPIIYTSDLFNPDNWYKPGGNNEWSFGSEYWETDPLAGALDLAKDLALKIRFIEYGDRYVDPFYLNVGNLNSMTIGHGSLMRNFANDADFPVIRRLGLNTGFEVGSFGMELVTNDLTDPRIFGARARLFKYFGISTILDIDPDSDLDQAEQDAIGNPIITGIALDVDIPIIRNDLLMLRAFVDVAAVLPYTQADIAGGPAAGMQWQMIYDPTQGEWLDGLRNYGLMAGVMGRILMVDWRLEYRNYRGAFKPSFFNASYERTRLSQAREFYNMLVDNIDGQKVTINGIYGEASFSLIKDKISFTAGYMMPWSFDTTVDWPTVMNEDYITASLIIKKGLIPVLDLYGSITYQRSGFVGAMMNGIENFSFLDASTVFRGEIVFPLAPALHMAAIFSTAVMIDAEGNIIYDVNYNPQLEPTITFETRLSF